MIEDIIKSLKQAFKDNYTAFYREWILEIPRDFEISEDAQEYMRQQELRRNLLKEEMEKWLEINKDKLIDNLYLSWFKSERYAKLSERYPAGFSDDYIKHKDYLESFGLDYDIVDESDLHKVFFFKPEKVYLKFYENQDFDSYLQVYPVEKTIIVYQ